MGHKFINEIKPGETVDDIYLVKDPVLRSTTNGGLYIAAFICDKSGQLNGRMWHATEGAYNSLPKPGFIHISGRSEIYQNNLQLIINQFSVVDTGKVDLADYLPRTDKDTNVMFEQIKEILRGIKNPQIKALLGEYFADNDLMDKFRNAPAAMKLHHSCLGGLLEHTHQMLKVAEQILPLYPKVNPDLVMAGIFLHDMGKTEELTYDMAFSYTDSGQLIGHISLSYLMLHRKADKLAEKGKPTDKLILDSLSHIIISHHGQYEFGSPKLPAIAEAFMVNYIDDLDAKIWQVTNAIDDETGDSDWTAWHGALGTKLYRKRLE
ncbi:MAG: HD domain-containing protein [Candidatus Brocadiia bacterium]|nr:MAG: HD domain-containing protein [Candidatus Brocadiia bacterium]